MFGLDDMARDCGESYEQQLRRDAKDEDAVTDSDKEICTFCGKHVRDGTTFHAHFDIVHNKAWDNAAGEWVLMSYEPIFEHAAAVGEALGRKREQAILDVLCGKPKDKEPIVMPAPYGSEQEFQDDFLGLAAAGRMNCTEFTRIALRLMASHAVYGTRNTKEPKKP